MSDPIAETLTASSVPVEELSIQKSFLEMQDADFEVLKSLQPFAITICNEVAKEFYDLQFADETLFHYFEDIAKQRKINLSELRARLEMASAENFLGLFTGLDGQWNKEYFEQSLFSNKEGEGILLPPKWYIAANAHLAKITISKIAKKFWFRPLYVKKASEAFLKLMNLNVQMVVDRYNKPFSRIVDEIQLASEHTSGATHKIQEMVAQQSNRLAEHNSEVHQVEESIGGLSERLAQVEEMSMALAESLNQAVSVMVDMQQKVSALSESIHEQKLASDRASEAVKHMEGVSDQFIASTQQTLDSALELEREMTHLKSVAGEFNGKGLH